MAEEFEATINGGQQDIGVEYDVTFNPNRVNPQETADNPIIRQVDFSPYLKEIPEGYHKEIILDQYIVARNKGYKEGIKDYIELLEGNTAVQADAYATAVKKGYRRSKEDFIDLMGIKKKDFYDPASRKDGTDSSSLPGEDAPSLESLGIDKDAASGKFITFGKDVNEKGNLINKRTGKEIDIYKGNPLNDTPEAAKMTEAFVMASPEYQKYLQESQNIATAKKRGADMLENPEAKPPPAEKVGNLTLDKPSTSLTKEEALVNKINQVIQKAEGNVLEYGFQDVCTSFFSGSYVL